MNIRRVVLDVDKAFARPHILEIAAAIEGSDGVEALNIEVTEIDTETVGMEITVEGGRVDYEALIHAIENTGAVVHGIDQLATGIRLIEPIARKR